MEADIVIPYEPRPLQKEVHSKLARFSVIVCHRRWGKTVFAINELIRTVLTCEKHNPRGAYICPLHKQAKQVAWDWVKHYSRPIPGISINEAELRIDYPNGGRVQLMGADNVDALRGIYLDIACLDEFSQMTPRAWSEVIRPALSDRKGAAIFIGTPMGHNNFYELYERAHDLPDWEPMLYKASKTNILDEDELQAMRRELTPAEYQQELECSFDAAIRGAYYADEMAKAQITDVPHDPALSVITSWDLGISDATVIWFWQVSGAQIRAIECLAFQSTGLPDIVKELQDRPYNYAQHIAPHDIEVRELGSGLSRKEIAYNLGVKFYVAPKQSVADGINAVRSILPRTIFDRVKCRDGIEALKLYRTEYDDKRQVFRSNPLHDWTSDYADSVRYFATSRHKVSTSYKRPSRTLQAQLNRASA